ncbi:hypothetical protein B566_EDAN011902 [Ephemera danica]|nr:hypothetical protein B566_EDAN011902 [Ephemera danica]
MSCGVCNLAITVVISWLRQALSREQIIAMTVQLCTLFNIQREHVCRGFAESHVDLAMFLYRARLQSGSAITPNEVCGLAIYPACRMANNVRPRYEWSFNLDYLGPKPPLNESKSFSEAVPPMQVLHITDVHVDPTYTPGSNAMCQEPTCCRRDTPGPVAPGAAAGYWGDYRDCDSPFHAFTNLVEQAAKSHPNVSYVMFTGDAVDHAMWTTNEQSNRDVYMKVIDKIREHFPDVPLLPAIGNHEPHPVNVWVDMPKRLMNVTMPRAPQLLSSDWVYNMAADAWSRWLPSSIRSSVHQGGSYAYEVKPGLLVVSINNNFCFTYNWWLLYRNVDPAGQLRWLADTLLKAEEEGQKVHILAHLAGNTYNCLAAWRRQYQRIIHRFEDTVVAQFHGHEHTDYFTLYFDPENRTRPTQVAFTAGSATPYTDVNPNYRVYTIEAEGDFRVLDHETWYYNLTEANVAGPNVLPNWMKLYSFNEAYNTTSLTPTELHELWLRMARSRNLQVQYFRHTMRDADSALRKGCDNICLQTLMCDIVDPHPQVRSRCILPRPMLPTRPPPQRAEQRSLEDDERDEESEDEEEDIMDLDLLLADLLVD